ncbi:MAG: hypothetical protein P1S60_07290 [Anaerolineae bacterium]|nr:hypothetical protein [Anaerolineae bacterium]
MLSKRVILLVLFLSLLLPATHSSLAQTGSREPLSASTIGASVVGDEIIISTLDNTQMLLAVAYNSLHDEYLVVWTNQWPATTTSTPGVYLPREPY